MWWQAMQAANRSPLVTIFLFPATLVILFVLETWDAVRGGTSPVVWQVAVVLGAIVLLVLRDLCPRTVLVVQLAAAVAGTLIGLPVMAVSLSCLFALCGVAARSKIGSVVVGTATALGVWLALALVQDGPLHAGVTALGVLAVLAATAVGRARRCAARRTRQLAQALRLLEQSRDVLAGQSLLVERSRIAWELHDIVAHGLALIAMRAGIARSLMPVDPDHASEAVVVIENAAKESLGEMRRMLRVLRSKDEPVDDRPQPGLWQLDELVATARSAGLEIELIRSGMPRPLPHGHELTAFRIVQEALTNVRKHAGAARTSVTLRYLPGKLVIEVFNEASRHQTVPVRVGGSLSLPNQCRRGLIGMRERVGLYGGTLLAGDVGGGFEVTAEIPLHAA